MPTTTAPSPASNSAPNNSDGHRSVFAKDYIEIPIAQIERDPTNRPPSVEGVAELAGSLEAEGLLQPVVVRQISSSDAVPLRYRLVAGERRWLAAQKLKWPTIGARVLSGMSMKDNHDFEVSAARKQLVENLHRQNLNPVDKAKKFQQIINLGTPGSNETRSQSEVAKLFRIPQPTLANLLRILKLPEPVLQYLREDKLTQAHGEALLRFADWPTLCLRIAELAVREGWSSKSLLESMPFQDELVDEGLVAKPGYQWEPSSEQRKDPAFVKDGYYGWLCLDPEKWKADKKARAAKKREETKLTAAKEGKQARIYYAGADGTMVEEREKYLLALVSKEKQVIGRAYRSEYAAKGTLVTDKGLWERILAATKTLIAEDRQAKLDPIVAKAWKNITAARKLDTWTNTILFGLELDGGDFGGPTAQKLKLSLAKRAKDVFEEWDGVRPFAFASLDHLQIVKLAAGVFLTARGHDIRSGRPLKDLELDWLAFLAGVKDRAEIKLLTNEQVLAALRPRFPIIPPNPNAKPTVKAAKPAKKGGRK